MLKFLAATLTTTLITADVASPNITMIKSPLPNTNIVPETTRNYGIKGTYMSSIGNGSLWFLKYNKPTNEYIPEAYLMISELTSSTGFKIDFTTNIAYICAHSNGLAMMNYYFGMKLPLINYTNDIGIPVSGLMKVDLNSKKVLNWTDFYKTDNYTNYHFANDIVTIGDIGYVPDSFDNKLYVINLKTMEYVKIISYNDWNAQNTFSLDGIAVANDTNNKPIILVNSWVTSKIYKVDPNNNYAVSQVTYNNLDRNGISGGFDGMVTDSNGLLYVTNNQQNFIYVFSSNDGWNTTTLVNYKKTRYDIVTSVGLIADKTLFVSSAYFDGRPQVALFPTETISFKDVVVIKYVNNTVYKNNTVYVYRNNTIYKNNTVYRNNTVYKNTTVINGGSSDAKCDKVFLIPFIVTAVLFIATVIILIIMLFCRNSNNNDKDYHQQL